MRSWFLRALAPISFGLHALAHRGLRRCRRRLQRRANVVRVLALVSVTVLRFRVLFVVEEVDVRLLVVNISTR